MTGFPQQVCGFWKVGKPQKWHSAQRRDEWLSVSAGCQHRGAYGVILQRARSTTTQKNTLMLFHFVAWNSTKLSWVYQNIRSVIQLGCVARGNFKTRFVLFHFVNDSGYMVTLPLYVKHRYINTTLLPSFANVQLVATSTETTHMVCSLSR